MMAVQHSFERFTHVLHEVKAVGHLHRLWRSCADGAGIICGPIARHNCCTGMLSEPGSSGFGGPVRKQVNNFVALTIDEDGTKNLALAKRKSSMPSTRGVACWGGVAVCARRSRVSPLSSTLSI
jgi:hypothetical protein